MTDSLTDSFDVLRELMLRAASGMIKMRTVLATSSLRPAGWTRRRSSGASSGRCN
jgi:hypothetical protein